VNQAFILRLETLVRTYEPDVLLVTKLLAAMWDAPEREWVEMAVRRGMLEAYNVPQGLILIETMDWSRGRELSIYGMVGRGILVNAKAIIEDFKRLAAYKGCNMIGGVGIPEGWKKAAPRLGFRPVSTHYVMEL